MERSTLFRIVGGAAAVIILVLLGTWLFGGFVGLSAHGAGALIFGVAASLFLGIGLMVAAFASSRSGQDEAAHEATKDQFKDENRN